MAVCHWSCRNTLEAKSPMSSDMAQGEGLEPKNGPCGEAAGESWLSLLSHPILKNLVKQITLPPELCLAVSIPALWYMKWMGNAESRLISGDSYEIGLNFSLTSCGVASTAYAYILNNILKIWRWCWALLFFTNPLSFHLTKNTLLDFSAEINWKTVKWKQHCILTPKTTFNQKHHAKIIWLYHCCFDYY